jgi:hypothetical protein
VTGHKAWRALQRYTNLKPEELYQLQTIAQPSLDHFHERARLWRIEVDDELS